MTIGKKVTFTCLILVTLSLAMASVAITNGTRVQKSVTGTSKAIPKLQRLAKLQALGLEFRGTSLLMGTPGLSDDYKQKQNVHLDELKTSMLDAVNQQDELSTAAERVLSEKTKTETASFVETCEKFRQLALSGNGVAAGAFWSTSGGVRSKAFRQAIQNQVEFENKISDDFADSALKAAASSRNWCLSLAFLAVLSGCGLTWFLVSHLDGILSRSAFALQEIATQVHSASSQVATTSRQVAAAASAQAASLQETSASGYEVRSLTARNAESSQLAFHLIEKVDASVVESSRELQKMNASMDDITKSSQEITKITKVIEDLAFQTNILALNAAVEAARAGEAGLGFAVVADEVRGLAARCSAAAKTTSELIEHSVQHAGSGSLRLSEVTRSMQDISRHSSEVNRLMNDLSESAREQLKGVDQISSALIQMEKVTQDTAGNAEEGANASLKLETQSESMQDIVLQLQSLIHS